MPGLSAEDLGYFQHREEKINDHLSVSWHFRDSQSSWREEKNYLERGKNTQNLSISLSDVDAALMGEVDWIESFTMCASLTPHH